MEMDIAILILWIIVGIATLSSDKVSKISYFLIWVVLILEMIKNIVR